MGDCIVDINKASLETLESLKGVGRAKAKAIIQAREKKLDKTFQQITDLLLVPGIGKNLLHSNRQVLHCNLSRSSTPRRSLRAKRSKASKGSIVNMNSDKEESIIKKLPTVNNGDVIHQNRLKNEQSDDEAINEEMQGIEQVHSDLEDNPSFDDKSAQCRQTSSSGSSIVNSSIDCMRQQKQRLSSRLRNKTFSNSLGSDTPHEEVASDILDVPLSPMRITDGDEMQNEDYLAANGDASSPEELAMPVDECSNYFPDKKQAKRKSEGNLDQKGLCPVKKSCKAVDSSELVKVPMSCYKLNPPPGIKMWLTKYKSWSSTQKVLALDSLINVCDLTQVRHIHQTILPQFQRDFIALLPKELALYVLSFLEPKNLLQAAQTCRYWNALTSDNLLWKRKCIEAGLDLPFMKEESLFECNLKDTCSNKWTLKKKKSNSQDGSFSHMSPFKIVFMRQHRIEMNWRVQPLKPPAVLRGHDDHVITCLQFSDDKIVSGSDDNTLNVWDASTGTCVRSLVGHTGGVWSSQMCNRFIVSGSTDRMLRVWNADTGSCIHTLYGHTSTVRCLHLHGHTVVSGSRDATLRVWNVISGMCDHVLVGHVAAVRCVQYNGKLVVSGAYDYLVKIWDPKAETCIHTLHGHTNRVYSLQFDGVHVVSGSLDTSIRVWDVETGLCRHSLMGHQSLTSGMELKNNILISGNADSTVKVWDILTGQCLQTLSGPNKHRSAVTCLQFNKKFVVTSSDDGTVKLWDVKTGEFIRNLVVLQSGGAGGVVWRIRASETKLVCAVGSRNGTEETKLLVLDFDATEITSETPSK